MNSKDQDYPFPAAPDDSVTFTKEQFQYILNELTNIRDNMHKPPQQMTPPANEGRWHFSAQEGGLYMVCSGEVTIARDLLLNDAIHIVGLRNRYLGY